MDSRFRERKCRGKQILNRYSRNINEEFVSCVSDNLLLKLFQNSPTVCNVRPSPRIPHFVCLQTMFSNKKNSLKHCIKNFWHTITIISSFYKKSLKFLLFFVFKITNGATRHASYNVLTSKQFDESEIVWVIKINQDFRSLQPQTCTSSV